MKKLFFLTLVFLLGITCFLYAQADNDDEDTTPAASTAKTPAAPAPTPPAPTPATPSPTEKPAPAAAPATPAAAQPSTPPTEAKAGAALPVKVHMFLLNIGKFDLIAGKYTAEFELELTAPEGTKDFAGTFDLLGGRIIKKEVIKTEEAWNKHYKVEAEIDLDLDFKRYPWDSQDLSIVIYDPENDTETVKFEIPAADKDESLMDEKVKLVGWNIDEETPTVSEDSFMDPKEKYSMYTFSLTINRLRFAATMKVLFPLTIMVIISFLALFIGAGAAVNRLTILTGVLLAACMFHLNASSSLPPIGYLTMADKIFFSSYLSFLLNLIMTVVMLKANEQKNEERIKSAYGTALVVVPLVTVILWGLAFSGIM